MKDIRKIITVNDENCNCLYERSIEIDTSKDNKELREIVKALKDTIKANNLTSLAAPAIGINRRVFVIKFADADMITYVNPVIAKSKGLQLSREKQIVVPDKEYIIPRNNDIQVFYQRPTGQGESRQFIGLAAMVIQQECQLLEGITIEDLGLEVIPEFDEATEEERQEVISSYLESLDIRQKEVDKEIQEDKELKQLNDGINFMTKVMNGEVELMPIEESQKE